MPARSGLLERFPYSLSRWTDLPAAKWGWFQERLQQGQMAAIDPKTGAFDLWSLRPEDTLGMVFWTREPTNLILNKALLEPYKKVIHFTLTGWHEVESKAPTLRQGLDLLSRVVDAFGPSVVQWRFSPVPAVEDVVDRYQRIADHAIGLGLKDCFAAFLQNNDLMPELRSVEVRNQLLNSMVQAAPKLTLLLCNEDNTLRKAQEASRVKYAICEDGSRFKGSCQTEGCGCALAVDPFTVNESCKFGCKYCYAADKDIAPKKHNTTRGLPVIQ